MEAGSVKMRIELDLETGEWKVYKYDGKESVAVKPNPVPELKLSGIRKFDNAALVYNQSNPKCWTYIIGGQYFQI